MIDPFHNVTAEEYGTWLVKSIEEATDKKSIKELTEHYELLVKELSYLERCFNLPSYEPDRSV